MYVYEMHPKMNFEQGSNRHTKNLNVQEKKLNESTMRTLEHCSYIRSDRVVSVQLPPLLLLKTDVCKNNIILAEKKESLFVTS